MGKCIPQRNDIIMKKVWKTEDPYYDAIQALTDRVNELAELIDDPDSGVDERLTKLENLYGVGAIWITLSNLNPEDLFGGTWQKIEDEFLLCSGSISAGSEGGSNSRSISIQLENLPAHNHHLHWNTISANGGGGNESWCNRYIVESGTGSKVTTIGNLDNQYENTPGAVPADYPGMGNTENQNDANNHPVQENVQTPISFTVTPAYVSVNVWKRIA